MVDSNFGDISSCDREPVRTIGAIQPHGVFYACTAKDLTVTHASANAENAGTAIGKQLSAVLGAEVIEAIRSMLKANREKGHARTTYGGSTHNAVIHRIGGASGNGQHIAIELESAVGDNPALETVDLQRTIDAIKSATEPDLLLRLMARTVRELTGYDRVMAYRFDEEWNGEVAVDDRHEDMPSWLHFRYPSSDIPAPARELFRKNWSRIIPTVQFTPAVILPETDPESSEALDLTYSVLRSPSPIHVEYLKNMQVGASFTLSLLCNGRLWGMMACHHRTPYFVDFSSRDAAELLAMAASAQLSAWEAREKQDVNQRMKLVKQWLETAVHSGEDPTDVLVEQSNLLIELTQSAGVAIVKSDEVVRLGACPPEAEVRKIVDGIKPFCTPVYAVRNITHVMPSVSCAGAQCAGVMGVKVTRRFEDEYIMWFRPEMIEEVIWGGDPRKNIKQSDGRIHPRRSFAAWKETVRNTSTHWSAPNTELAAELAKAITAADQAATRS